MEDTKKVVVKRKSTMFLTLLKVGTFTIGGGFTMIPIMRVEFVEKLKWLSEGEFADTMALAQAAPGAMVINLSVYLGYTMFGVSGALLALLGSALPALLIMGAIGVFYAKVRDSFVIVERIFAGVKPVIAGIILAAAIRMADGVNATWLNCLLMLGVVVAVAVFGVSPILCVVAGGAVGIAFMRSKRDKRGKRADGRVK